MNGTPAKVEVVAPFNSAIQLTRKILFEPFSLEKWLVIGFAAFLSHFAGGGGFTFNFRGSKDFGQRNMNFHWSESSSGLGIHFNQLAWLTIVAVVAVFVLAVLLVLLWVGARGRFIFLDCIVHNRGAIVQPWRDYREQGNSFFLFLLATMAGLVLCVGLLTVPIWLPALIFRQGFHHGPLFVLALVFAATFFVLFAIAWGVLSQIVLVAMFTRRCRALEALHAALSTVTADPVPFILYALFLFVLGIGIGILMCMAICITCCIAAIPYVGTVILLPFEVCLASYPLLFLRQFGADWNAWKNVEASVPVTPPSDAPPLLTPLEPPSTPPPAAPDLPAPDSPEPPPTPSDRSPDEPPPNP